MDFRECELSLILVEGVEKRREQLVGISRFIWENPEVSYEKYKACDVVVLHRLVGDVGGVAGVQNDWDSAEKTAMAVLGSVYQASTRALARRNAALSGQ